MDVRFGKGLEAPEILEDLRSVVVYDDFGAPVILVQKLDDGRILLTKATDADFAKLLKAMGIGLNASYKVVKTK